MMSLPVVRINSLALQRAEEKVLRMNGFTIKNTFIDVAENNVLGGARRRTQSEPRRMRRVVVSSMEDGSR